MDKLSEEQELEIIKFYLKPSSLKATKKKFNLSHPRKVEAILKKYGVQKHSKAISEQLKRENTKLAFLQKYGVKSPFCLQEVKDKAKATCRKKYGVDYTFQSNEFQKNIQKNVCDKYGVDCTLKIPEIDAKRKQTLNKHYGTDSPQKSEIVKEKTKKTNLQKYGVENPMQNTAIQEKVKNTNLEKYGVENVFASEEIKTLIKNHNLSTYGVEYTFQANSIKEKIKITNLEKYGVDNPAKNIFIKDKGFETKKINHTFSTSLSEDHFYTVLCNKFGNSDIFRQYKDARYPFHCDFYIKSLDTFIELNYSWTHGGKPFENTPEDNIKLALWKGKAKTSKYYQCAIDVWTQRDVNKIKAALKNNLNYKAFYNEIDAYNWLSNKTLI